MTFDIAPQARAEQVVLERLRLGAEHRVSNYVLRNMEVHTWADEMADSVAFRFQSDVLAKALEKRDATQSVEFEYPATTWQMFKHGHRNGRWLGWLARRWPVRMEMTRKTAHFQVKANVAFPDCQIQFPDNLGAPIFFWTTEAKFQ